MRGGSLKNGAFSKGPDVHLHHIQSSTGNKCSVCIVVAMDNCFRMDMVFLLSYAHLISIIILKASVLHW